MAKLKRPRDELKRELAEQLDNGINYQALPGRHQYDILELVGFVAAAHQHVIPAQRSDISSSESQRPRL